MDQHPSGWRGGGTTRLEAFVDAAFAFAVTILVISAERIPGSVQALVLALKQIPAFAAGFALLALFWYAHVRWSRRYRLDGMLATLLSLLLVFLVLVYVYPLRLLLGTFFAWISGGWLPMPLSDISGATQIAFVFVFYGLAFASMSACMGGLYLLAWRRRGLLGLDTEAAADAMGEVAAYGYFCVIGMLSAGVALSLPTRAAPWQVAIPGLLYFLLSLTGLLHVLGRRRALRRLERSDETEAPNA
ncbi:TMEM175 family protein [Pseudoxanthomonas sp. 10H]|uniref:TMEM175 family protein n=1 Tax=Pseudoxanthomonas sp. 10H TaxID=3242729 RepID=UPI003557E637